MSKYQNLVLEIIYFNTEDAVATSNREKADDFGQWHGDWFSKMDEKGA